MNKNCLSIKSKSYILASYGSDNKYSGLNLFHRRIDMYINI